MNSVRFRSFLLCLFVTLLFSNPPDRLFGAADTVAVLPFFNDAHSPTLDWIGESVAETLRESLTTAGVLALSREDRVEVYKRLSVRPNVTLTRATVLRVGDTLDAAQVVSGRFELTAMPAGSTGSRGELKLTASVLDRKRLREGPTLFESGPLEDLSLLESRLAWQCVKYFLPRSAPTEADFLRNRPPVRVDAVESYIRGLLADSPEQQEKLFTRSAQLDPTFSEPAFQLGRIAFDRKEYRTASNWMGKVAATASHYHEAQFVLGLCRYYEGDFDAAAQAFQLVAAQVPLNEVFNDLGAAQSRRNRPEAVANFRKALEGDETDPDYWFNLAYALWKTGKPAEAAKDFQAVLDRTPNDAEAHSLLVRSLRGDTPRVGEQANAERIKKTFEETVFLQLQAELKK